MSISTGLRGPSTAPLLSSCVLCCPRVVNGVNGVSGSGLSEEGLAGLARRQEGPGLAMRHSLLSSLTHPPPATPAHSYFSAFALQIPLPGTLFSAFSHGGHLLILQLPGAMTRLLFNLGPCSSRPSALFSCPLSDLSPSDSTF